MGLSSYISVKLNRASFEFIELFEYITGSPLLVFFKGDKSALIFRTMHFSSYYPNEGETKEFFAHTLYPIDGQFYSFTFSATEHQKENDKYSRGIDFVIRSFIDAPYNGNEKFFKPFIELAKVYGYSTYTITSDYSEDVLSESFESPANPHIVADLGRYYHRTDAIVNYLLQYSNTISEENYAFAREMTDWYVKTRIEKMRKSIFKSHAWEFEYYAYYQHVYELRLFLLALSVYKRNNPMKKIESFISLIKENGYELESAVWDDVSLKAIQTLNFFLL